LGGVEQPRPAVARVEPPLDPAGLLHAVDEPPHRDVLDLEDLGEPALVDPLVTRQMDQQLPLRPAQIEAARALVELLAHQARDVMQQEAEAPFGVVSHVRMMLSRPATSKLVAPAAPPDVSRAPLLVGARRRI